MKYLFDRTVSLLGLLFLSPVFLVVAALGPHQDAGRVGHFPSAKNRAARQTVHDVQIPHDDRKAFGEQCVRCGGEPYHAVGSRPAQIQAR